MGVLATQLAARSISLIFVFAVCTKTFKRTHCFLLCLLLFFAVFVVVAVAAAAYSRSAKSFISLRSTLGGKDPHLP